MIYILSLNPSIDYHMDIDKINLGETNRSTSENIMIGGKGINVATVLNTLTTKSSLVGFVGGDTGNFIVKELKELPYVQNNMIHTKHNTRINVKLKGSVETEINGKGKAVSKQDILELEDFFNHITKDDVVIITGRIAQGMPENWYINLAQFVHDKGAEFIVDLDSKDLIEMCQYKPLLIKPNLSELESIFDVKLEDEASIIKYARKLIDLGAKNCIVSLGSEGSMFINENKLYQTQVPKGSLVNSVGAGDSMVAGFVYEYLKNHNVKDAYKMSVACGSATAYSKHLADKTMIDNLLKQIEIGG